MTSLSTKNFRILGIRQKTTDRKVTCEVKVQMLHSLLVACTKTDLKQIARFVAPISIAWQQLNMADSRSRVVSALNFLTAEGISYPPDGCNHSALEALIDEYSTTAEMMTAAMTKAPTVVKV